MKFPGAFRVKSKIKLVFPTKLKPRLAQRVVAILRSRMPFGQVGGMGGDFIGDHAFLDVLFAWQPQMFFGRHITKHCAPIPADHSGADAAGDMIVAGRYIGC